MPGEELRQHPGQKLHRLRALDDFVLGARLGPDVRRRQRVHRHARPLVRRRAGQFSGARRGLRLDESVLDDHTKASTAPSTGPPVPLWAKFFFQLVFAGTAATIVSGAVAERIKFGSLHRSSASCWSAFVYPITGHWIWGGGFLGCGQLPRLRRLDGRALGRRLGGAGGRDVLGPRLGKYRDGKVHPIPGHNMTSAALGVLILWLGWFGFNPGSTMAAGDGTAIAHMLVNTNMAAATGTLGCAARGLAAAEEAGSLDDPQRLSGRPGRDHRAVRVHHRSPRGAIIGFIAGILVVLARDLLRQDQDRRSGRRAFGAPGQRHLGHACARACSTTTEIATNVAGAATGSEAPAPQTLGAAQGHRLRRRASSLSSRSCSGSSSRPSWACA